MQQHNRPKGVGLLAERADLHIVQRIRCKFEGANRTESLQHAKFAREKRLSLLTTVNEEVLLTPHSGTQWLQTISSLGGVELGSRSTPLEL